MKDTSFEAYMADQAMIGQIKKSIKKEERDRLLNKACVWLRNNLRNIPCDPFDFITTSYHSVEDFISAFLGAMEE